MGRDCGTCTACLPACPTGALVEPGVLDARLCIAYWAQTPGVIPRGVRSSWGDRIYGCDACLDACPPGHKALGLTKRGRGRYELAGLLGLDDGSLLDRFTHFYVPRRRALYLRRNMIVALGNSGDESAVGVLAGYAGHPEWLLRAHAVWSLARLARGRAHRLLDAVAAGERHPAVLDEIAAARGPEVHE